jgi:uncharacterized membrane protein
MRRKLSAICGYLGKCFLAGLLPLLPVVLTVAIVMWVAGFLERFVGPGTVIGRVLETLGLGFSSNRAVAYVLGWGVVLAAVLGLGLVVNLGAKHLVQRLLDAGLQRIPLVGSVYGTSKQLVALFDRKGGSEVRTMSVVFCSFGQGGGPGVLALMPSPERFRIEGRDYQVVIVPTAPVPFGGGLLFMPVEMVRPLSMSVDGLLSIYVSMGVTTPQFVSGLESSAASVGPPAGGGESG